MATKKKEAPPANLLPSVRKYKKLQQQISQLEEQLEELKSVITAEMARQGMDKLSVDVYTVNWSKVVSSRFDTKKFKLAEPDLYKKYSNTSITRRFTVA